MPVLPLKIKFSDQDIRRISINADTYRFADLVKDISTMKKGMDCLSLYYFDEENDKITLSTELDWEELVSHSVSTNKASVIIFAEEIKLTESIISEMNQFLILDDHKQPELEIEVDLPEQVQQPESIAKEEPQQEILKEEEPQAVPLPEQVQNILNEGLNNARLLFAQVDESKNNLVEDIRSNPAVNQVATHLNQFANQLKDTFGDIVQMGTVGIDGLLKDASNLFNRPENKPQPQAQAQPNPAANVAKAVRPLHLAFKFELDVSIPDDTVVPANTTFTKIWRVKNTGDDWPAGCSLRHVGGTALANQSIALPELKSQEVGVITVQMKAPAKPGKYSAYYRAFCPLANDGLLFGDPLWCAIIVPEVVFEYQKQLEEIMLMGFDPEIVKAMLIEHKGNVDEVLDDLLSQ